jgi:thiamine transport system substrate-binding protein
LPIALLVAAIAGLLAYSMRARETATGPKVRVLSYPSFLNSWGPGPEIARAFKAETGIEVEFRDAGDGALMSKKVKLSPVDVVVGIDGLSISEARNDLRWRALAIDASLLEASVPREEGFVAYDWAPVAFVYREGEIDAPKSLSDLADVRFKGAISLQDPRTSTPGLQFLLWVLDEMGVDAGFEFLASLKPNIHSVSPTWSTAYGLFSKKQAKLAFSYLTSPMYHAIEEKNPDYRAAIFADGHPVQAEYAGVPESCVNCEAGERFVKFLVSPEAQAIVMRRNFMLPVLKGVTVRTEFENLPQVRAREWKSLGQLLADRVALFERWRSLGL